MEENKMMYKMTSYEDNGNSVGCVPSNSSSPIVPLSSTMDQANNMAQEILIKAYKINAHMFGANAPDRDETPPPKCFRDVLANQLKALSEATCELEEIMDKLGV